MNGIVMRSLAALVMCLALFGCDEEPDATEQLEAAEGAAQEAAEAVEQAADEAEGEAAEGLGEVAEALEGAAAAAAAGEGEGSHCEQALAGIQAMRAQLEASMGGNNQAPPIDEAAFLASCGSLPAGAQQCMVMSYAIEHQEECAEFQEQIQAAAPQPGN